MVSVHIKREYSSLGHTQYYILLVNLDCVATDSFTIKIFLQHLQAISWKTDFDDVNFLINRHGKAANIEGEKHSSSRSTLNVTFCVSLE
jgi:hypothetical protein